MQFKLIIGAKLQEIVLGQRAERDELLGGNYIPREGIAKAKKSLQNNLIKVIIGPRRAGKSVFAMQMLAGLNFGYLNFDDERLIKISDYDNLLKAVRQVYGDVKIILFDEIQNLPNWELLVNGLHRRGLNIIIIGSNAHLLSREFSTHLTGRYIQFQIFPFSFLEFLKAKEFSLKETLWLKERQGLILSHLDSYLEKGGYPEIVVKNFEAKNYLTTLFDSILFKDIVKRYNVKYTKLLSDLASYLISNHANEFSFTKLKNTLGFRSVHTVENYTQYLTEAFLIFSLDRFKFKFKEQIRSPRKVYGYDLGIINALKFKSGKDIGRMMESLVAIELLRRGFNLYYYKSTDGKEVDFVIRDGGQTSQLFQVSYNVDDYATKKREVASLLKAGKELGCAHLVILTWDYEAEEKHNDKKIIFYPLWKWLIKKGSGL